jgi:hypothetical protein
MPPKRPRLQVGVRSGSLLDDARKLNGLTHRTTCGPAHGRSCRNRDYATRVPSSFLLVVGERRGLAWILRERRMAFPPRRHLGVDDLAYGDQLFLMTTRNCLGNPGKDRSRVFAKAYVASSVAMLEKPLKIGNRTFDRACDLLIEGVAPFREGVELGPLVPLLDAFPNKREWKMWLRRPLLRLSAKDALLVASRFDPLSRIPDETVPAYLDWIGKVAGQRS